MKPISTTMHGVLDYMTAGTLFVLPRMMNWSPAVRALLTGAGAGALAYSLITNYELGAVKALPMKAHLALDAMSGATLLAAPFLLKNERSDAKAALIGIGLFELAASMMTKSEPSYERDHAYAR